MMFYSFIRDYSSIMQFQSYFYFLGIYIEKRYKIKIAYMDIKKNCIR